VEWVDRLGNWAVWGGFGGDTIICVFFLLDQKETMNDRFFAFAKMKV